MLILHELRQAGESRSLGRAASSINDCLPSSARLHSAKERRRAPIITVDDRNLSSVLCLRTLETQGRLSSVIVRPSAERPSR